MFVLTCSTQGALNTALSVVPDECWVWGAYGNTPQSQWSSWLRGKLFFL